MGHEGRMGFFSAYRYFSSQRKGKYILYRLVLLIFSSLAMLILASELLLYIQARRSLWKGVSIKDAIVQPDHVLLVVRVLPDVQKSFETSDLSCSFRNAWFQTRIWTPVKGWAMEGVTAYVRCEFPQNQGAAVGSIVTLEQDYRLAAQSSSLFNGKDEKKGERLVYASETDPRGVYVFVKGLQRRNKVLNSSMNVHCKFGDSYSVKAKTGYLQVVLCPHPPKARRSEVEGKPLTLVLNRKAFRSVAEYSPLMRFETHLSSANRKTSAAHLEAVLGAGQKDYYLCSCTMVFNVRKFLKEWILYHSWMGIQRFFLYDNNSDDEIEEAVSKLARKYNVSMHPWPWMKSQEAGFSHCLLRASSKCTWILFTDVDEFIYPKYMVHASRKEIEDKRKHILPLHRLVHRVLFLNRTEIVGQISFQCISFGPSGLKKHPKAGVTTGYTCRIRKPDRHKSFTMPEAVEDTLQTKVHHFVLKDGYMSSLFLGSSSLANINHYKYQAWDEFKIKYHRRVSSIVRDWRDSPGKSLDRAPILGSEPIEPNDWEKQFCERKDTSLRDLVQKLFGSRERGGEMIWQ